MKPLTLTLDEVIEIELSKHNIASEQLKEELYWKIRDFVATKFSIAMLPAISSEIDLLEELFKLIVERREP